MLFSIEFPATGLVLPSVEDGIILTLQMEIQALPYQMYSKLDQPKENYCKLFNDGFFKKDLPT